MSGFARDGNSSKMRVFPAATSRNIAVIIPTLNRYEMEPLGNALLSGSLTLSVIHLSEFSYRNQKLAEMRRSLTSDCGFLFMPIGYNSMKPESLVFGLLRNALDIARDCNIPWGFWLDDPRHLKTSLLFDPRLRENVRIVVMQRKHAPLMAPFPGLDPENIVLTDGIQADAPKIAERLLKLARQ